jgi:hypothetical protein
MIVYVAWGAVTGTAVTQPIMIEACPTPTIGIVTLGALTAKMATRSSMA